MMRKRLDNLYLEKESCRQVTHNTDSIALVRLVPEEARKITNWHKVSMKGQEAIKKDN